MCVDVNKNIKPKINQKKKKYKNEVHTSVKRMLSDLKSITFNTILSAFNPTQITHTDMVTIESKQKP